MLKDGEYYVFNKSIRQSQGKTFQSCKSTKGEFTEMVLSILDRHIIMTSPLWCAIPCEVLGKWLPGNIRSDDDGTRKKY